MHILSVILFVISASLDNLIVGIAYGIKKLKISILSNLLIAFISCAGTFLSMALGKFIGKFISGHNANFIGSSILILLGLWFILNSFKKNNKVEKAEYKKQNKLECYKVQCEELLTSPEKADMNNSGNIDLKEAVILGFVLALNNMGLGIGASITGLSIILTSIFTFVFSLTAIPLGYILGKKYIPNVLESKANLISGIIILLLALYEMFI